MRDITVKKTWSVYYLICEIYFGIGSILSGDWLLLGLAIFFAVMCWNAINEWQAFEQIYYTDKWLFYPRWWWQ